LSSEDLPESVVVLGDAAIALREPKPDTILEGDLAITPAVFGVTRAVNNGAGVIPDRGNS
jgi:hypothetical protein